MESRFIACEPNFLIANNVNIQAIKEELQEKHSKNVPTVEDVDVNASKLELQKSFSMKRNMYLRCKWTKFLEDVPEKVLIIKNYTEYNKKIYPVRRMMLDGSFYHGSGKLIPVPYLQDPRK